MTEIEALTQRLLELETKVRALEAERLDPEAIARRALEILRTDPQIQVRDFMARIKSGG